MMRPPAKSSVFYVNFFEKARVYKYFYKKIDKVNKCVIMLSRKNKKG